MATFYIRTRKESGNATLYAKIRKSNIRGALEMSTGIIVDIASWNKSQKDARSLSAYQKSEEGARVYDLIRQCEAVYDTFYDGITVPDIIKVKEAVFNVVHHEEKEIMRKEEEELIKQLEAKDKALRLLKQADDEDILKFLMDAMVRMKNGELITRLGTRYSVKSIKHYDFLKNYLEEFGQIKRWSDITKENLGRFRRWMEEDREVMDATINGILINLRAITNMAYQEGIHNDARLVNVIVCHHKPVSSKNSKTNIALTSEEVQALYEMPLRGDRAMVRDLFLIGVYTCQRVSDYSEINRESFTTTIKGNKVIRLVQHKTGTETIVPILNDNLLHIMERCDYHPLGRYENSKSMYRDRFFGDMINGTIKDILKDLSHSVPSLKTEYRTILSKSERIFNKKGYEIEADGTVIKPKYDMVTSHTARRTGITLLYKSAKFTNMQLMSISGHKKEETFRHYIKIGLEEMADDIVEIRGNEDLF